MFFRKAKRIKELEKENDELRRLYNLVRLQDEIPLKMEQLNIEKACAVGEFPTWYDDKFMEDEVKYRLFSEVCPFMKIERAFSKVDDKYCVRASIRVVKER